jgi:hypothetical protein
MAICRLGFANTIIYCNLQAKFSLQANPQNIYLNIPSKICIKKNLAKQGVAQF